LGGVTGVKPLPVGLLLVTQFESGTQWRPRELSAGKGALALFENTVSARRQPEKALCTIQKVMSQAQGLKGRRGEAKQVVNQILQILEPINALCVGRPTHDLGIGERACNR